VGRRILDVQQGSQKAQSEVKLIWEYIRFQLSYPRGKDRNVAAVSVFIASMVVLVVNVAAGSVVGLQFDTLIFRCLDARYFDDVARAYEWGLFGLIVLPMTVFVIPFFHKCHRLHWLPIGVAFLGWLALDVSMWLNWKNHPEVISSKRFLFHLSGISLNVMAQLGSVLLLKQFKIW